MVYQEQNLSQNKVSINGKSGGTSLEGDYLLAAYIHSQKAFLSFPQKILAQQWGKGFGVADYGGLLQWFRKTELNLWEIYKDHVYVKTDRDSSVMEVKIQSYDKSFSKWLNNRLLGSGQQAISRLSRLAYEQTIVYNERLVVAQKQALQQAIVRFAKYQEKTGIINLKDGYGDKLRTLGTLDVSESLLAARVSTYRKLEHNNQQTKALDIQLKSVQNHVKKLQSSISGDDSLASHAKGYTMRYTAMQNAEKLLEADEKALMLSQQNLLSHRYVISYISPPSSPMAPTRPYRWWDTFWVFLGTSVLYLIIK